MINRLGFNNEGHEAAEKRLAARKGRAGIVGVNIGANKDSADRIGDYELGVARFAPYASYLTVNISSPNTPGLRNMQAREQLGELLSRVIAARAAASAQPPIFLKIAPDLVEAELEDIAAEVTEKQIDGVIVSNTTIARPALRSARRRRARPAGSRASRCSSARPSCWPGCASCSARSAPSSASAASIRPRRRWRRSAPAPISSSSTPA